MVNLAICRHTEIGDENRGADIFGPVKRKELRGNRHLWAQLTKLTGFFGYESCTILCACRLVLKLNVAKVFCRFSPFDLRLGEIAP